MNTNQESPRMNSWWHSDSPACNWLQKVELEFDIKQKLTTVCTFSHRLGDECDTRVKVKGSLFQMTCLPKFLWETEVFTDMWPSQNNLCERHVKNLENWKKTSKFLVLPFFSCCINFFFTFDFYQMAFLMFVVTSFLQKCLSKSNILITFHCWNVLSKEPMFKFPIPYL